MPVQYFDAPGTIIEPTSIKGARAAATHAALTAERLDYVRLVECRQQRNAEITAEVLILDVDVERPQVVIHDIKRVERLACVFPCNDSSIPDVLALRSDFPEVSHLNLRYVEFPKSLCLYEDSWEDVRQRWTPAAFIERIRQWLADTAIGSLHREDQPLEQVLGGAGLRLVIPYSVVDSSGEAAELLDVALYDDADRYGTLVASPAGTLPTQAEVHFVASLFISEPRQHGVIRRAPRTLEELCEFLSDGNDVLLTQLRERVPQWKDSGFLDATLILIVVFPLERNAGSGIEVTDTWAFMTVESVFDVGREIGIWDKVDGQIGFNYPPVSTMRGAGIKLDVLRPHFTLTRSSAARASGTAPSDANLVVIGAGALGSFTIVSLIQSGFGKWTIVDDDVFLPHNAARHALPSVFVGWPKADALSAFVASYLDEAETATPIRANLLHPGELADKLNEAMKNAAMLLDFSASVPAARHLTHEVASNAKRLSAFLTPRGTDLVIFCEDAERTFTLDTLEAQYYRAVLRDEALDCHLAINESRTRYSRTCRDVSLSLPSHILSMHAAVAAQEVRRSYAKSEASIRIWRADPADCTISNINVPIVPSYRAEFGEWTLVLDQWILARLQELRKARLPNETGGVLLGMVDLPRKTVYVVDTIASPKDSKEEPSLYIRGCSGLADTVIDAKRVTADQVEYIGEWHSHPDGCSCAPSALDLSLFAVLTDHMTAAGLPVLMTIVGDQLSAWHLGVMAEKDAWKAGSDA